MERWSVCINGEEEEDGEEEDEGVEEGWIGVGAIRLLIEGKVVLLLVAVVMLGVELIPDDEAVLPIVEGMK